LTENMITTVRVDRIKQECLDVKTLYFNVKLQKPKPGQFLMVWIPGIDEIPMSVSGWNKNNEWSITVKNVGECTENLSNIKTGDYIGIRGPLGNHFTIPNSNFSKLVLIAGGIGVAPIKFLADDLINQKRKFTFIEGAKSENQLIFKELLKSEERNIDEIIFCTDDGSFGTKAFAPEMLENLIPTLSEEFENVVIYACGPELMLYEIFNICKKHKIKLQVSLERVMRCGCGLCGLCALDPLGLLVCKDGPVFNSEQLRKIEDFGRYKRNFAGKKIKLN
jgi:dihydroorotate dehydrogenase electron transfer subunit